MYIYSSIIFSSILIIYSIIYHKINRFYENNIINIVLSKLKFSINNYIINRYDNKIIIKSHIHSINISNRKINDIMEYKQDLGIYNNLFEEIIKGSYCNSKQKNPTLFICIQLIDIIIDFKTKKYKIINSNFNIRKPTYDKYKLFSKILYNLDNPYYYFNNDIIDKNLNIDKNLSEIIPIENNNIEGIIYEFDNFKINFINNYNDNKYELDPIVIRTNNEIIINDIDNKPYISNQIKIIEYNGTFI